MSGSGNDFILIDNRQPVLSETNLPAFIEKVCRRKMSVGADGLILIEESAGADFRWRFFNSDGSSAEMCGNGARCAARYAYLNGIADSRMVFETAVGLVTAELSGDQVRIQMTELRDLVLERTVELKDGPVLCGSVNTGVPHVVIPVADIESAPVIEMGREIRFHPDFGPAGTNVNFIQPMADGSVAIRTYERGVEDETLACGTGAVAAVIVTVSGSGKPSPIRVRTRSGGCLTIHFSKTRGRFGDVFLEGDARVIYKGELCEEAWAW